MPVPGSGAEPAAWLSLHHAAGHDAGTFRALLSAFGSPSEALRQPSRDLARIAGPGVAATIARSVAGPKVEAAMAWLAHPRHHLVTLGDADYPRSLLEIPDPPPLLFLKGCRAMLATSPYIAIVGSRNASPSGMKIAQSFAESLARSGVGVVSGLALGIDAAAHRGCLAASGSTIAVIGTGIDIVYPARNKSLAGEIAENGAIISEYALGTPGLAANFPRRNRIISGLSRGVLVIEAAIASGSLITARQAGEQGRDVYAVPGSIHSPLSKGCHHLIKQGAKLVDDCADILDELGIVHAPTTRAGSRDVVPPLLGLVGNDPFSPDDLVDASGRPAAEIMAEITGMELGGWLAPVPGGRFQRLR